MLVPLFLVAVSVVLSFGGYVADGLKEKKPVKGWLNIARFIAVMGSAVLLLKIFGLYFALAAPLAVVVFVCFAINKKSR